MSTTYTTARPVPPWPVMAAALLSFVAFAVADGLPPAMPLLVLGLLAVYAVPYRVERATRTIWLIRVVLLGVVYAMSAGHESRLMDTWMTGAALNVVGPLLAGELVLRAWHRPAHWRQMVYLSALVILAACSTPDERVGLYLVPPYFFCVIFALRADRARPAETSRRGPALLRAGAVALAFLIGGIAHWGFRTYQAQIVAWGSAALGDQPRPSSAAETSGIVKDPTLGPTFGSPGSSTRILRIVGGLPDPHLHGMAFDTYARGAWLPTLGGRSFTTATPTDLGANAPAPRVNITRFVDDDGMVSAPLSAAGLVLGPEAEPTWARELSGPVRHETSAALSYQVVLGPGDAYQGPLCAPPSPAERARCLVVPAEIDPRVRALAQQVAGQLLDPRRKVEAVQDYLLQNNRYSLRTDPGRGDPVSNFLLRHKAAHCEFFASSAAILLRCVGVPTRYAIGYYAHENDGPSATVVRGQDAHAWAESWIDGTGWVVVEATPGNGRPDRTAKTPFWWKLRDRWQDLTLALQTAFAHLTGPRRFLLLAGLIVVLLLPSLFRALSARLRRPSPASPFVYAAPPMELSEMAARFESWLAARGDACPPERPWQEHLWTAAQEGPARADSLTLARPVLPLSAEAQAFITAYNRARFGDPTDSRARTEAAEALRRLEHEA